MKFCPKCEVKLKKSDSGLQCSKCGYTEGEKVKPAKKIVSEQEPDNSHFLLLKEVKEKNQYSTIKMECEKCGHDKAVWWMFQTRSADEPTTRFYRCQKCKYTWRDYT